MSAASTLSTELDLTMLHIDEMQAGLGGINSWGKTALEQYLIPPRDRSYSFWQVPHHMDTVLRSAVLRTTCTPLHHVALHRWVCSMRVALHVELLFLFFCFLC